MNSPYCPKCTSVFTTKNGIIKKKQRFKCKNCRYNFTIDKQKQDNLPLHYVTKALQLHFEGFSYREIKRLLGVSHVTVMNWVKKYRCLLPKNVNEKHDITVLSYDDLVNSINDKDNLKDMGMIITELGSNYMVIKWKRFNKKT